MSNGDALARAPHVVYRAFDKDGRLLYVGCTVNLDRRMSQHRSQAPWRDYIASVTTVGYPDKASARTAETRAIDTEGPFFNASIADMKLTQSNLHAATRLLWDAGIYQHHADLDELLSDPEVAALSQAENTAWYELREELRVGLKATTHPYLTDEDRTARYLAACAAEQEQVA